ncbi:hypothetical protein C1G87_1176 [Dehalococcoides mccartyi]|uniref:Uncharacterized protein n=1 Tax=Dehalococcoides mccartyi TaxID=61435 RepID=A0A328EMC4_9CHLR|nr:hypothetical protein C1G87_1176 [Dehalococcoides mccartyi]
MLSVYAGVTGCLWFASVQTGTCLKGKEFFGQIVVLKYDFFPCLQLLG